MDKLTEQFLLQSVKETWTAPWSGSIYNWASKYVSLPHGYAIKGKFDVSISRYLIQPFDDLLNDDVRQVNIGSAVKTFKSGIAEVWLPYLIINDPDPLLKIHQTLDIAKNQTKVKLTPLLLNCKPVADLIAGSHDRYTLTNTEMSFPKMDVKIYGPSDNVLQTLDVRYIILEEAKELTANEIQQLKARATSFEHNCKLLFTGQRGREGDGFSKEFNSGIIYEWSWKCPDCQHVQPYYWNKKKSDWTKENQSYAGIKWDKVYLKDGKTYNLDATSDSARIVCYQCPCELKDTPENRKYLNDTGTYQCIKNDGLKSVHSYTWTAFANQHISFKSKVIQYLQAVQYKKQTGLADLLDVFDQKVMGKEVLKYNPLNIRKIISEVYDPSAAWPDEAFRFMTVDYQKRLGERWYEIVAWAKNGESRLIKYGHVHTWDEIERIANDNKVLRWNVMVDSGFNSQEVYAESVLRGGPEEINGEAVWLGWTCLNGDGLDDYKVDGVRQYYKESFVKTSLDANPDHAGKFARLITFSNPSIKTILFHLKEGNGVKWLRPTNDSEYERQLNAEQIEEIEDPKTGLKKRGFVQKHDDNHLFDCEMMQVLAAYMVGALGNYSVPTSPLVPSQELPLAA